MRQTTIPALLAGALAGFGAATVTSIVTAPNAEQAAPSVSQFPNPARALEARLAALERENADLRERVAALESVPVAPLSLAAREDASTDGEELESLQRELEDLVAALRSPNRELPPSFRQGIERVLEQREAAREAEREARRAQERAQRTEERIQRLTTDLGLAPYQVDAVRGILLEEAARREALFTAARESGDMRSVRDEFRKIGQETLESLSGVLTPDQLEKYQAQSRDFGRFGRGGGRSGNRAPSGAGPSGPGSGSGGGGTF